MESQLTQAQPAEKGAALLATWDSLAGTEARCAWLDGLTGEELESLALELGRRMLSKSDRLDLVLALSPEPAPDLRR